MRADRLLSLMMLLQSRGKMTARELGAELEVSERTIYRDIDALSIAGVPVYAERGPGGGCGLLHDYRLRLTGLTEAEIQAFFMLRIPTTLAALGADREAQSALLKITAALPGDHRADEARIRQRIHMDPAPWFEAATPAPTLQVIYQALFEDRKLRVRYRMSFGAVSERIVDPLGLTAKGDQWHLVFGWQSALRVVPVEKVLEAEPLNDPALRPADFDLKEFWAQWVAIVESNRPEYMVVLLAEPHALNMVAHTLGVSASELFARAEPPDDEGRARVTVVFSSFAQARTNLLGWGHAVEVVAPRALRLSVADYAAQIVALYADS